MSTLSTMRLGRAMGGAFALTYLGCMLVMNIAPKETTIRFFNSIMHGVNVEPIMRWDIPLWESALGTVEVFVLGWLFGAAMAALYNVGVTREA